VTGNNSFGIAVSNICVAQQLDTDTCDLISTDIQPDSDNNRILRNTVLGNGTDPDPVLPPVFAVDLAWDGTGVGNCWTGNVFGTFFWPGAPDPLPAC